jgi:phosphatidylethanolamine-binding protein (PEBP) family uncharacterized protein
MAFKLTSNAFPALDAVRPDLGEATKAKLEAAMKPHLIAQAELIATYQKR